MQCGGRLPKHSMPAMSSDERPRWGATSVRRTETPRGPAPPSGGSGGPSGAPGRRPPQDPTEQGPYRDRPNVNVTLNNNFNLTPTPGESPEDFAARVVEVMRTEMRQAGLTYANDPYAYGPG